MAGASSSWRPRDGPGGALYTEELTLPGYLHDVGAAFFPFADHSPAFRALDLNGTGLAWRNARFESCHPAPDGSCAAIARDPELSARSFGADGPAWRRLARWEAAMGGRLVEALLAPLPALGPALRLGRLHLLRLGLAGLSTPAGFARRHFQTEAARRVIPALALHVDLGPEDFAGTGLGLVLAFAAAGSGFRVPVGGAKAITEALLRRLREAGGTLRLDTHADAVVVRGRRAVAVRTNNGDEVPVRRAVLADVTAPGLFLRLLPPQAVSGWVRRGAALPLRLGHLQDGLGAGRAGAVVGARGARSAVVHTGDSVADLIAFTRQVRRGELPDNPYLVIGQQSLVDPSRAPPGCHTLWAYSRVPPAMPGGWTRYREHFADRIEARIEGLAPGFRGLILGRSAQAPPDLEAMDENLVGGDLGGGSARFDQQLFFRPLFPYFRYRTPVRGVYLASASAHPGAGVHGACGFNAARMAIGDQE